MQAAPSPAATPPPLARYLAFARSAADRAWEGRDEIVAKWAAKIDPESVFGYRPPPRLLETAAIYAFLYDREGKKEYAERAAHILVTYGDFRGRYPASAAAKRSDYAAGVPALPDFFTTMRYIRAFAILKRRAFLDAAAREKCTALVAESIRYLLRTQEWGAMNRAALRAETLAWALAACPDHPDAPRWRTLEEALGNDNFGKWEIEDATIYHAVWLCALLGYADAKGIRKELFETPQMYYYARYYLELMSPDGMVPDFGDANFRSNWSRYLLFFEAAAAAYKSPELKWAAATIASRFIDWNDTRATGLAYLLLDCFRYGSDEVAARPPKGLSREALDDVVGKKIVFRTGWAPDSTYLLLNYRDEGDGGLLYRDYLRDTIPVEEEKMTHGHSDENGIALLMAKGSILLHDGGYRDFMPSGPFGAYRQDYFHNRLCVRPERIWMGQEEGEFRYSTKNHAAVPGQAMLDFLHDGGAYRRVRTFKVDFLSFDDFDYSRTRVVDERMGYQWDRVIAFVKEPQVFVVLDFFKALEDGVFTAANLWHTRKITDRGPHWYDTAYDRIGKVELPADTHLLVLFPADRFRLEGVEKEKRHYQDEFAIYHAASRHFELGETAAFATVLVPHAASEDPRGWAARIEAVETDPAGAGLAVVLAGGDRTAVVGAKADLRMDMVRDSRRPRYTWEAGRVRYGDLVTNGDFFFLARRGKRLDATVVDLTKAIYRDKTIFEQPPSNFGLAFDGGPDAPGVGKARYYRGTVILEGE